MLNKHFKKLLLSVVSITALLMQNNVTYALTVKSSTGEEYEISESLFSNPADEQKGNLDLPILNPTYGDYYKADSELLFNKKDLMPVSDSLNYPYSTTVFVESEFDSSFGRVVGKGSANFIKDNVLITAAHNVFNWT